MRFGNRSSGMKVCTKYLPLVRFDPLIERSEERDINRKISGRRFRDDTSKSIYTTRERETRTIHSLVVEAFVGIRPEGKLVRHLDGDITNNVISNLSYGTNSENMMDRIAHGTSGKQVRRSDGKVYPTINSAAEDNSVGRTSISQALRKGYRAAGFHWELVS